VAEERVVLEAARARIQALEGDAHMAADRFGAADGHAREVLDGLEDALLTPCCLVIHGWSSRVIRPVFSTEVCRTFS
jgi:hypothetical protein